VIFPWYNQALKKLLKPVMGGVSGIKKRSSASCWIVALIFKILVSSSFNILLRFQPTADSIFKVQNGYVYLNGEGFTCGQYKKKNSSGQVLMVPYAKT
jgi:hypothetical protein